MTIVMYVDQAFQNYGGGIYSSKTCPNNNVNHAMVITGYNAATGYWSIKNSWGAGWGEQGYVRVTMAGNGVNSNGPCSLYMYGGWYPTAGIVKR